MKLREKVRIHKKPKHLRDHFQLVPLSTRREMFKKPKHSKLFFCTSFTQERSRVVGNEIGCLFSLTK